MAIDPARLTDRQLQTLILNHKRLRTFDDTYRLATAESARRGSTYLSLEVTLKLIQNAAAAGHFVSYLEICEANGAQWEKARFQIFRHLGDVLDYAYAHQMPLLTAIVVAKNHLKDGDMDVQTRVGFVTAARELGFVVDDEVAFLKQQQEATFAWANAAP